MTVPDRDCKVDLSCSGTQTDEHAPNTLGSVLWSSHEPQLLLFTKPELGPGGAIFNRSTEGPLVCAVCRRTVVLSMGWVPVVRSMDWVPRIKEAWAQSDGSSVVLDVSKFD